MTDTKPEIASEPEIVRPEIVRDEQTPPLGDCTVTQEPDPPPAQTRSAPVSRPAFPTSGMAFLLCLLLIGLQLGAGLIVVIPQIILEATLHISSHASVFALLNIAGSLVTFGLVLLFGLLKTGLAPRTVLRLRAVSPAVMGATAIFALGLVIISSELDNLVQYLLPMPDFIRKIFDDLVQTNGSFLIALIHVGMVAPLTEEPLFRGLILDGINRTRGYRSAIIISAFLFAFIHLNPWQFVTALLFGLFAAWITLRSGSILPALYIHFFNNALGVVVVHFLANKITIPGFIEASDSGGFHPLWLDLTGIALTVAGLLLLRRFMRARPTTAVSEKALVNA